MDQSSDTYTILPASTHTAAAPDQSHADMRTVRLLQTINTPSAIQFISKASEQPVARPHL